MRCIIILLGILSMAAAAPVLRLAATVPLPMGIPRQAAASADGRTVFMAHDEGWNVVAVDVSDPRRPRLAGVGATGGFARSVAVWRGRVVAADTRAGVRLLDLKPHADPLRALPVTGRLDTSGAVSDLVARGDTLYVAGPEGVTAFPGNRRIRLTPPIALWGGLPGGVAPDGRWRVLEGPDFPGGVTAAGAGDRYLALARGAAVQVIDREGPPKEFTAPSPVTALRVYGDRALLCGGALAVADLATGRILARAEARPNAGTYGARVPAYVDAVRPRPGLVAAVDRFWGLRLFAEDTLEELGNLPTSGGDYTGLQADGDRLYVGNNWGGVTILDLADPDHPKPVGTTRTATAPNFGCAGFLASGDRLWVQGNEDRTLRALDVGDPRSPRLLAAKAVPKPDKPLGDTRRFGAGFPAWRDGLLYLPGLARILRPDTLDLVGQDPDAGYEHDCAVLSGDTLVLSGEEALTLVDVSDPVRPRTVARLPGDYGAYYFARALRARGGLAYLVNRKELRIVDVANRRLLSTLPLEGEPVDLQLDGDRAWVAAYYGGLHVVDVRDATRPARLATFRQASSDEIAGNPPCYQAVEVARGRVYVAEYYSGVQVLRPDRASTSSGGG